MKNIHILPTDKPSRIYKNEISELEFLDKKSINLDGFCISQNIYITSDEEIQDVRPHKGKWQLEQGQILNKFPTYLTDLSECKLVIMTTDQDLIKDGVQAIDDDFLEWFVNNPSCEEVEVKPLLSNNGRALFGYKIIIPKEEPCEHFIPTIGCIKDVCSCNKDPKQAPFKHKVESLSTEEVLANRSNAYEFIDFDKQETLEEAADRYFPFAEKIGGETYTAYRGFKAGAKWQQEQILDFLYSEITERRDYSASKMCEKIIEFIKNK